MSNTALFEQKAPRIMHKFMVKLDLDMDDAAAILGNFGHECGGFRLLQERKPTVRGSRGGYGWAQWTGKRRRQYEDYCKVNDLNPADDDANFGFAVHELQSTEKQAVAALKRAQTLKDKVEAFEAAYERAGVKHYARRLEWAELAKRAYLREYAPEPQKPPVTANPPISKGEAGVGAAAAAGASLAHYLGVGLEWIGAAVAIVAVAWVAWKIWGKYHG